MSELFLYIVATQALRVDIGKASPGPNRLQRGTIDPQS